MRPFSKEDADRIFKSKWTDYEAARDDDHPGRHYRANCPGDATLRPLREPDPVQWWQEYVEPSRDRGLGLTTRFIRRRVKFGLPPEHPDADKGLANGRKGGGYRYPPFGCVLVIWDGARNFHHAPSARQGGA